MLTNPMTGQAQEYTIVGILKESNGSIISGSPNSNVYMTMDGIKGISNQDSYSEIFIRCDSPDKVDETADAVKEALNRVHRNEAFSIVTVKSFSQAITAIFDYIKYILGGIAGISLVVGGIGIMNVMMLTVKERTKEIGLMKAVGATTGNVRNLFLVESTLLGVISGLIGLAVAIDHHDHHRRRRRHAHGRVAAERADRPGLRGADDDYRRRIPGQPGGDTGPDRRAAYRMRTTRAGHIPACARWYFFRLLSMLKYSLYLLIKS